MAARLVLLCLLALAAGCTGGPPGGAQPVALSQRWMIGVEPMTGDALPLLPFTDRLLVDLAAMPDVQAVFVGSTRNAVPFAASAIRRITLRPWLHGEGNCMTASYTVHASGQDLGSYALVTPAPLAGSETDLACIDRFATQFYGSLVRQGF